MNNVISLLKESGAMLEGHFLLSSGRHSDRYFQCARLMQYPEKTAAALEEIIEKIRADMASGILKIGAVAGPAMGAVVLSYEFGRQLGLPAIFTERDDTGVMRIRRFEIRPGTRFLVVEDAVTTGKSVGECAAALESAGATVSALACIVDRRLPGNEIKWPFYSAVKIDAANWDPADCELCKKGVPAVKPGSRKI